VAASKWEQSVNRQREGIVAERLPMSVSVQDEMEEKVIKEKLI
jgi:hypothetical protein